MCSGAFWSYVWWSLLLIPERFESHFISIFVRRFSLVNSLIKKGYLCKSLNFWRILSEARISV
jgi:hypothetical protein